MYVRLLYTIPVSYTHLDVYKRQSGKCLISRPDNMEQISAWRVNSLNFYLTPLGEIIKGMDRHYDVHFIVKDSAVLKNRFTLSTGKVNASDVLYAFCLLYTSRCV